MKVKRCWKKNEKKKTHKTKTVNCSQKQDCVVSEKTQLKEQSVLEMVPFHLIQLAAGSFNKAVGRLSKFMSCMKFSAHSHGWQMFFRWSLGIQLLPPVSAISWAQDALQVPLCGAEGVTHTGVHGWAAGRCTLGLHPVRWSPGRRPDFTTGEAVPRR